MENEFISVDTKIKDCFAFPKSVFWGAMSSTAKLLYVYLLAQSLTEKIEDLDGFYYLMLPIKMQTEILGKSEATIKRALQELENNDLIFKRSFGVGKVNKLYVRVPCEG